MRVFEDVGQQFFKIETDFLIVLDEHGNIERVNPSFERETGYAESEVLGSGMIRMIVMEDWGKFLNAFTALNPEPFHLLH